MTIFDQDGNTEVQETGQVAFWRDIDEMTSQQREGVGLVIESLYANVSGYTDEGERIPPAALREIRDRLVSDYPEVKAVLGATPDDQEAAVGDEAAGSLPPIHWKSGAGVDG